MTVIITDTPVAALRAQLSGNVAEHKRLLGLFSGRDDRVAYSALVHAAFLEAVSRRFGQDVARAEVVAYVADVRSRFEEAAAAVDPRVGEHVILESLGGTSQEDTDTKASSTAMLFLLTALVADEGLTATALDQVIAQAKKTAEYLLNS
jgi:hypothetical protein